MLLTGKTAIVTGAGAGIGKAIAHRFVGEGASVVLVDIDEESGRRLEAELRSCGGTAVFLHADMGDVASIRSMVAQAEALVERIDILVNNAGITRKIALLDITEAEWDTIQSVNTRGLFFCLQAVAKHMRGFKAGKIVNMSSIGGKGFAVSNAGYAASKAAAIAIARVAAMELGPFNINVNSVCPGATMSDLLAAMPPAVLEAARQRAALGRLNEPDAVADAVLFLCSSLADNITGQSVNVDNGTMWD